MNCPVVQKNGNVCGRAAKFNGRCGYHKNVESVKSPSPVKSKSPSPKRVKSPVKVKSPSPVKAKSASVKSKSPSPAKVKSPSPKRSKSPVKAKSPAVKSKPVRVSNLESPEKQFTQEEILRKPYPYKRFYLRINKLLAEAREFIPDFGTKEMRQYCIDNLNLEKYKDGYKMLFLNTESYPQINHITDFYTEKCRLMCRHEYKPISPIEVYQKNKYRLFKEARPADIEDFAEFLEEKLDKCSNYKLSYLLGVLDIFKPKRWLDTSAGWGDRLLAAIIFGVERYLGIDPNLCLHPLYKEMVTDLLPIEEQRNYQVLLGRAESIKLRPEKFDFIFTSPPFFTFEIYNEKGKGKELQSTYMYRTADAWVKKFLFKMIDNAWPHLEVGGNFVLYIEDKPKYKFIPQMSEHFSRKPDCVYDGIIYQIPYVEGEMPRKKRTLHCWRKV